MTQNATADRPPQVTVAGWVTMLGSVFLVLGMFDQIARLRTIDNRERIAESLGQPPYVWLGTGVDGVQQVLHTVFVVAGALGAAACVLGWFVLQRHKQARLVLSVVAVPLFLSGFLSGSIAASFVAVSAMLLWSGPARDWFAGRPVRKPPVLAAMQAPRPSAPPPDAASRIAPPPLPPTPTGVASPAPPPYAGFGVPRPDPYAGSPYAGSVTRPAALVAAAVITWVASAAVLLVFGLAMVVVLADPSAVRDVVEQQPRLQELGFTVDEVRRIFVGMALLFVGWALVAALLALLVMLRVAWARPLLIVSAIVSGLLSCVMAQAFIPVVTAVAGMVTAYLLLRPEVGRWVNRR